MCINYQYSESIPQFITYIRYLGAKKYTINFDVERDPLDEQVFKYIAIQFPLELCGRDSIISAIVQFRYPSDKMQAIINNYLLDSSDEEAVAEFKEMQAWRKHAKEIADRFLAEIQQQD